jgi:hypothetical protein
MQVIAHVQIRVQAIHGRQDQGFLTSASHICRHQRRRAGGPGRVAEYAVKVGGQDAPELLCLVTDLDDGLLSLPWRRNKLPAGRSGLPGCEPLSVRPSHIGGEP